MVEFLEPAGVREMQMNGVERHAKKCDGWGEQT
jgi:hypothetical protein